MDHQIITQRSKIPSFQIIQKLNKPITDIGIIEFGFDNNIFNIITNSKIEFYKQNKKNLIQSFILKPGYYELSDINIFLNNCVSVLQKLHLISYEDKLISDFYKPNLEYSILNQTKLYIYISNELKNYLKFNDNWINPGDIITSVNHFININTRLIIIRCDNIKSGEILLNDTYYNVHNSKIILSHFITSIYGSSEKIFITNPKFYKYLFAGDHDLKINIDIMDEFGNLLNYTDNSNFYIKFLIKFK